MEDNNGLVKIEADYDAEAARQLEGIKGMIKTFIPDLPKHYPMLEQMIGNVEGELNKYLGDDEKTIICARKNGQTQVLILDNSKTWSIDSKEGIDVDPKDQDTFVVENEEVSNFIKQKIMKNALLGWLREEYETKYKNAPKAIPEP